MTFPDCGTRCNSEIVDRASEAVCHSSNTHELFWDRRNFTSTHTAEFLKKVLAWSPWNFATWSEMGVVRKSLGPGPPKLEGGGQKSPKSGAISDNFWLRSPISLQRIKIWTIRKRRNLSLSITCPTTKFGELGPLTKSRGSAFWPTQKSTFSEDISAFSSCYPLNFYICYTMTKAC